MTSMLFAGMLLVSGCGTVTPKQPHGSVPSFSGNEQNSGIIGIDSEGNIIITPSKLDEYNSLIELYGSRFHPPLIKNAGVDITIQSGKVIDAHMDREHFVDFCLMLDMARKDRH